MSPSVSALERYVRMVCCACSAEWVEDRTEPGPTCPSCNHFEPWPLLEKCQRMGDDDGGVFVWSPAQLAEFFARCGFNTQAAKRSGRWISDLWTHTHRDGKTTWAVSVEVAVYPQSEQIRSIEREYAVSRKPALVVYASSIEELALLLAMVMRTVGLFSESPVDGAEALFCGHPIVE